MNEATVKRIQEISPWLATPEATSAYEQEALAEIFMTAIEIVDLVPFFPSEKSADEIEANYHPNTIRAVLRALRDGGYPGLKCRIQASGPQNGGALLSGGWSSHSIHSTMAYALAAPV